MRKRPQAYHSEAIEKRRSAKDPHQSARTRKKLIIAARIAHALEMQDLKKGKLAELLERNASEVSKWTSGSHNFTVDTLSDIEEVLNINLLNISLPAEKKMPEMICTLKLEVTSESSDKVSADKNAVALTAKMIASAGGMQPTSIQLV